MTRITVVLVLLSVLVACTPKANWVPPDGASEGSYPGEAWQKAATPEDLGWSSDGQYETGPDSIHPVYAFRLSTQDLARFGLLFLREGRWGDQQIIPADWVRESTATHSEIGPLLWLILDAAGETDTGDAPLLEAAGGIQVTAGNLDEAWPESIIRHLDGPERQFITSYAPDGELTFTARQSGEHLDNGKWWAEGDRVCRQWKESDGGEKACFHVVLDGTTLQWFDLDGILAGKALFARE